MKPCPFCGSEIQHIESAAKSFDPPRVYHEWRHINEDPNCWIYRRHHIVGIATDDAETQAAAIRHWNRREQSIIKEKDLSTVEKRNAFYNSEEYRNMTTEEKCAVQGDGFINDHD